MASTINALTGSGGVATTADASGILEFQNNGTTIATVSSTGIAMASGKTLTGDAVSNGKILQVVSAVNSTFVTTTSSSFVDTGLTLNITPTATSSKILIIMSASIGNTSGGANTSAAIVRGSTEIETFSRVAFDSSNHANVQNSFVFLDTPSTTSATTYKLQYKASGGNARFNDSSVADPASTITLMEVAG